MKTVILGAHGQLGRELGRALPGEVVALSRQDADLTKPAELRATLARLGSAVVVNAAGFTHVDRAETQRSEAFAVNAFGVRDLAAACNDLGATLIHFSTNYVFGSDATRTIPYREDDPPGPINVYGESKLTGECFIQSLCPRHFILRTCGLYGSGGKASERSNFVETMLRQAKSGDSVRVVSDQACTPTAAADLAQAVAGLIEARAYGLYHVTNAGACTWHEFARAIFELAGIAMRVEPIGSGEYSAAARRPRYSALDNGRWRENGFRPLRPWREALAAYLAARQL